MEKRKQVVADTRCTEAEAPTATMMQKTDSAEKRDSCRFQNNCFKQAIFELLEVCLWEGFSVPVQTKTKN